MRIIAPMMILIMMTSTQAGCTGGDPDGGGNDEINISMIEEILENSSINLPILHSQSGFENSTYLSEEMYMLRSFLNLSIDQSEDTAIRMEMIIADINLHLEIDESENDSGMRVDYATNLIGMNLSWKEGNETLFGEIVIELNPTAAPYHVENFKELIRGDYYDNTIFHRIIESFMIQGGDFEYYNGYGGHAVIWSGFCNGQIMESSESCPQNEWTLPDEADNNLQHEPYSLSMAKTSSPNTGGSQFFIVSPESYPNHLNGVHTVFGRVIEGQNIIDTIEKVETGASDNPINNVTIDDTWFIGEGLSTQEVHELEFNHHRGGQLTTECTNGYMQNIDWYVVDDTYHGSYLPGAGLECTHTFHFIESVSKSENDGGYRVSDYSSNWSEWSFSLLWTEHPVLVE